MVSWKIFPLFRLAKLTCRASLWGLCRWLVGGCTTWLVSCHLHVAFWHDVAGPGVHHMWDWAGAFMPLLIGINTGTQHKMMC